MKPEEDLSKYKEIIELVYQETKDLEDHTTKVGTMFAQKTALLLFFLVTTTGYLFTKIAKGGNYVPEQTLVTMVYTTVLLWIVYKCFITKNLEQQKSILASKLEECIKKGEELDILKFKKTRSIVKEKHIESYLKELDSLYKILQKGIIITAITPFMAAIALFILRSKYFNPFLPFF